MTIPTGPAPHTRTLFPRETELEHRERFSQGPFFKSDTSQEACNRSQHYAIEAAEVPMSQGCGTEEDLWCQTVYSDLAVFIYFSGECRAQWQPGLLYGLMSIFDMINGHLTCCFPNIKRIIEIILIINAVVIVSSNISKR
jgi:hypothetical protein